MTRQIFLYIDEIVLDGVDVSGDFQGQLERELWTRLSAPELAALLAGSGESRQVSLGSLALGELRPGMSTLGASLGRALLTEVVAALPGPQTSAGTLGIAQPGPPAGLGIGSAGKE